MWKKALYNLVNKTDAQRRGATYPNKRSTTPPEAVCSVAVLYFIFSKDSVSFFLEF